MNTPLPKRRWPRFSLRTVFVFVTLAALLLGVRFGWRPSWLAQRREFLAQNQMRWNEWPPKLQKMQWWGPPHVTPSAGWRTRFLLRFYGQPLQTDVRIPVMIGGEAIISDDLAADARAVTAAALFPEAAIVAVPMPYPRHYRYLSPPPLTETRPIRPHAPSLTPP